MVILKTKERDSKGCKMSTKLVSYLRVSTKKQGESGLGLEGQETAIDAYAKQISGTVIGRYIEVESGKRADRAQLARAIAHAKRMKAVLVVAKLDRLARNVAFLSKLLESGIEFVATDNPSANRLTIHILAAVAEAEAKAISERTKAALAAAKARGTVLGSARKGHWNGREDARLQGGLKGLKASAIVRSKAAAEAYSDILPSILALKALGMSLQAVANKLNAEGHQTREGAVFTAMTIHRIINRAG